MGQKLKYPMVVGLEKGHPVTKNKDRPIKPSNRRRCNPKVKLARDLIREVCGLMPYEKRCQELLKISRDKRALKFLSKRLGTFKRGKRKREEMQAYLRKQRARQQAHKHDDDKK